MQGNQKFQHIDRLTCTGFALYLYNNITGDVPFLIFAPALKLALVYAVLLWTKWLV
jgi:hypothetical protein